MINSALGYIYKTISSSGGSQIATSGALDVGDATKSIWIKRVGTRKADSVPVLTLTLKIQDDPNRALALNGIKKLKTFKHPSILKFLSENIIQSALSFSTEWAIPVSSLLGDLPGPELILWGFLKILSALEFLHVKCNISHNNVCLDSMYSTMSGEWKLGDCEWARGVNEPSETGSSVFTSGLRPPDSLYPPEGYSTPIESPYAEYPVHSSDVWCFGASAKVILNHSKKGNYPPAYADIYHRLERSLSSSFLQDSPTSRCSAKVFLEQNTKPHGCFDIDFIDMMDCLEKISVKTLREVACILEKVRANIATFSPRLKKYKVLPILISSVGRSSSDINLTELILDAAQDCDENDFRLHLRPVIKKLSLSGNYEVRAALIDRMHSVYPKTSANKHSSEIAEVLISYLGDQSPYIRDRTVRASINYVESLTPQDYSKLIYTLYSLLRDQEHGIRVNTIVCLTKMFMLYPTRLNKEMVAATFTSSLSDKNREVRLVALSSIATTAELYSPKDLITFVIPKLLPSALDPDGEIRSNFHRTIRTLLDRLNRLGDAMHSGNNDGVNATPPVQKSGSYHTLTALLAHTKSDSISQGTIGSDKIVKARSSEDFTSKDRPSYFPIPSNAKYATTASNNSHEPVSNTHHSARTTSEVSDLSDGWDNTLF